MKKLLCGAILCLSFINSYSQIYSLSDIESDLSAMFAGLDKSRITTGFLWDKSANLVEPALFNGQFLVDSNYVDLPVFHDIIFSLNSASTGPAIMEPDSIISLIQNRTHNQTIAVGFLFQKYNYITADALSCGKINYNNGVVSDSYNGDVWINPYGEDAIFAFGLGANGNVEGKNVLFDVFCVDSLQAIPFSYIKLDAGDSLGFRTVTQNNPVSISYSKGGYKEIKLCVGVGNVDYFAHAVLYVSDTSAPVSMAPSDYTKVDISVDTLGRTFSGRISYYNNTDFSKTPLIVAEGFDPWGFIKTHSVHSYSGFTDIEDILWDTGINTYYFFNNYAVYYIDWYDHNADIRGNAELMKRAIRWVNANKHTADKNIVMGQSMGGLIARIALKEMEEWEERHQTNIFISHDAPYLGANITPGLLFMFWDLWDYLSDKVQRPVFQLLFGNDYYHTGYEAMANQTSIRQMIPYYVDYNRQYNYSLFSELQAYLDFIGFPEGDIGVGIDNIAIVNGGKSSSGCNGYPYRYGINDKVFSMNYHASSLIEPSPLMSYMLSKNKDPRGGLSWIPGATTLSFSYQIMPFFSASLPVYASVFKMEKSFLWTVNREYTLNTSVYYPPSNAVALDGVWGSTYPSSYLIDNKTRDFFQDLFIPEILGYSEFEIEIADSLLFIPTASALCSSDYSRDFFSSPILAGEGGPFDSYILNNTASPHISFFTGIDTWLYEIKHTSIDVPLIVFGCDSAHLVNNPNNCFFNWYSLNPSAATIDEHSGVINEVNGGLTKIKAYWSVPGQVISKSRDVIIGYPSVTLSSRIFPGGQCVVRANGCSKTEISLIKAAVDSSIILYKWGVKINDNPIIWRTASTQDTIHVNKPSTGSVTVYMKWERSNGESGGVVSHPIMRGGSFNCSICDIYEDRGHIITYTECLPGFPEVTQEYGHQCLVLSESTNHDPSGEIVSITIGEKTFDLTGTMVANSGELLYVFDILYDSDFLDELYYTHTNGLFGYRLIDIYINDSSGPFQEVGIFYRKELNTGGPILDD